jgi:sec-independent protein translocase protein TatA
MDLLTLLLFSIGGPEIILILFVILLLFGAKKIPELAKGLGKGIREFKDATKEVKDEIDQASEKAKPED